jgi:hypothetical protein
MRISEKHSAVSKRRSTGMRKNHSSFDALVYQYGERREGQNKKYGGKIIY